MKAKLSVISGLAHASGMSSFNDGVTDQKQKDMLEKWRRELSRVVNCEERTVDNVLDIKTFGYGGNPRPVRRWTDYVDLIAEQRTQELVAMNQKASSERGAADAKYRKDELLRMYKEAASAGRYIAMPAAKGNSTETYIKNYVANMYPEWGKIIRVSAPMNYNVHRDKLGNIKYRSHSVDIVCEDQGYKAVHSISMHEEYFGSKYRNGVPNSDRWNSGPLKLVK